MTLASQFNRPQFLDGYALVLFPDIQTLAKLVHDLSLQSPAQQKKTLVVSTLENWSLVTQALVHAPVVAVTKRCADPNCTNDDLIEEIREGLRYLAQGARNLPLVLIDHDAAAIVSANAAALPDPTEDQIRNILRP